MSKGTLYGYYRGIWAGVAQLARHDLGLADQIKLQEVNLDTSEHLEPWYLAINPKGTVPSLVVDGKSYAGTIAVTDYLISIAEGPARNREVKPFITPLQDTKISPGTLKVAARTEDELKVVGPSWMDNIVTRQQRMLELAATKDEWQEYWKPRLHSNTLPFLAFTNAASAAERQAYFVWSQGFWAAVLGFLVDTLPQHLPESGFIDGSEPGVNDFQAGAWVTSVSYTAGGLDTIEKLVGKPLDKKLFTYLDTWKARKGWQECYKDDLY